MRLRLIFIFEYLLWGLHCLPWSNSHIQVVLPSLGADVPLDSWALFHKLPNPVYSSSFQQCRYPQQSFYRSISPDGERHLVRHHCPGENTAKHLPAQNPNLLSQASAFSPATQGTIRISEADRTSFPLPLDIFLSGQSLLLPKAAWTQALPALPACSHFSLEMQGFPIWPC